jgi:Misato Segment II tubulin-like domain
MKELIYIHASSSYIASHFFNSQQSYFVFDDLSGDKPVKVDPDVSFREGLAPDVGQHLPPPFLLSPTFPRAPRPSVLASS